MEYKKYLITAAVVLVVIFAITHVEALREFFAIDAIPA